MPLQSFDGRPVPIGRHPATLASPLTKRGIRENQSKHTMCRTSASVVYVSCIAKAPNVSLLRFFKKKNFFLSGNFFSDGDRLGHGRVCMLSFVVRMFATYSTLSFVSAPLWPAAMFRLFLLAFFRFFSVVCVLLLFERANMRACFRWLAPVADTMCFALYVTWDVFCCFATVPRHT